MKILFVCRGNVGRSQMAEGLYHLLGNQDNNVSSVGTKLSGPEEPIINLDAENVIAIIKDEGADISTATRKQLTQAMVDSADQIYFLRDENDPFPDNLKNNPKVTIWEVQNPKGTDLETLRKIMNDIKSLIKTIV